METISIKLKNVQPNPYRGAGTYHLQKKRTKALESSISQTGFWSNIVGRLNDDNQFEIAYGHHRLQAAKNVLGENHEQDFVVVELTDYKMLQMMSAENSEDWGNTTEHNNLTVVMARDMLDEWFDSVKVIGDDGKLDCNATMSSLANSPDLHGIGKKEAVEWFGGGDVLGAKKNLAKMVKASAGRGVIAAFIGMKQNEVRYSLESIGMSSKEAHTAQAAADKAREKQKKLENELKAAKKDTNAKDKAAKEKRIQADLDKAAQDEADALTELEESGSIDRKAVEVFEKPIHAKAFCDAVSKATANGHLPLKNQMGLALKVLNALGEEGLSARAIESYVNAELAKLKKTNTTLADYSNLLNGLGGYCRSVSSNVNSVRKAVKDNGITSMTGPEADKMQRELAGVLSSIANLYGDMGRFAPSLRWEMDGTTIKYHVKGNDPMYTENDIYERWGIDLGEYEEIA